MIDLLIPFWLMRLGVATVWLYEGAWCKLLHGQPHEFEVIAAVPYWDQRSGARALQALGVVEIGIAIWSLSSIAPIICAATQTALLVLLNGGGLRWARHIIHDPAGMVVRNLSFLVLVWATASLPGWR
jgi:hypothetical protein